MWVLHGLFDQLAAYGEGNHKLNSSQLPPRGHHRSRLPTTSVLIFARSFITVPYRPKKGAARHPDQFRPRHARIKGNLGKAMRPRVDRNLGRSLL
jgi:hypothetical protein